ncbi:MAG: response regulator [Planctomycetes bacterium]|nr:response regulator [Planctomycetota bacterium]
MVQATEGKKDKPAHRVLLYVQTAEDVSILQDILTGIGAEGVVCTDFGDLCWRTAHDVDAALLTEQSLVDGVLPILAEALLSQPEWSDLPVLFVAAGGAESPLAVQAMQELPNVVILDRPVRIATLASVLRMASRVRGKQRQVRYLLEERERQEQRLRQLTELLKKDVKAKTETLTDTMGRLDGEMAGRALAEEELHKSAQMLEAFFAHTISPLVFLDRNFNFVRVNEAYARADGRSPGYLVGKNLFTLYPSLKDRAIFERVVRTRQPYRAYAEPFAFPEAPQPGVTYWNWWLTPLLNNLGEVRLLVLNLEDVTERQKAFSELQERARQLQQLTLELSQTEDRERKRLAEILHDDLQQLLAAAKFHLGLLNRRITHDTPSQETAALVKDLLTQAIGQSRSLSHELSPPALSQGDLRETFQWLAQQVQAKHGLTVHLEVGGPIELESTFRSFLYKAAREMLFNVIKHAGVSEARLRLRRRCGYVCLSVSDKGCGFDTRELDKVGGAGLLGVREQIKFLGGRLKATSTKGRGSLFIIAVPDRQKPLDRRQTTEDARQKTVGVGPRAYPTSATPGNHGVGFPNTEESRLGSRLPLRVLLADDHKIVRQGIRCMVVGEPDIEIVGQAANGREAVDLADQLHPDVVIMDMSMPLMSGDEAARQIKSQLPQTRIVALSMFEDADVRERMHQAGAESYLLKTAPSEELLAAIRGPKADGDQ